MKRRGFTLIEILVVVLIIAMLSAAAVPMLGSNLDQVQLRGTANRLTEMMSLAASLAITERQTHRINFDPENGIVWMTRQPEPLENPNIYEPVKNSSLARLEFGEEVRLKQYYIEAGREDEEENEAPYIAFRLDGTADEAMMEIENRRGEIYTLMVSKITGRVRMLDHELEPEK